MPRPCRVGFINSHPIQYTAPLFRYMTEHSDRVVPVALYLTDFSLRGAVDAQFGRAVTWDLDLLDGYEHHFVGADYGKLVPAGFTSLIVPAIARTIREQRIDVLVLHGHAYAACIIALAAARLAGIPVFYKGETHLDLPRSRVKGALRAPVMGTLFTQIAQFLAIGSKNAEFYRSFGIGEDRIVFYPYTVDNDRFASASRLDATERAAVRAEYGLSPDRPVVTYASKFMPRKHPDDLLRAAQMLAREGHDLELLFVGTGELGDKLKAMALEEPALTVRFAGFVNQTGLPRVLGASDVFVLPSENEPFGLIVNEAMCAGLPVVAAEEIGSVGDLVRNGENGAVFDAGDVPGLAAALRTTLADSTRRTAMGERSREIIAGWSYAQNLAGLHEAVRRVHPA